MERRANPEQLLKRMEDEERSASRGRLTIFFGYAAGVGKTYAMLKSAHAAARQGVDVILGYIEPHARPKTAALVDGLEVLPTLSIKRGTLELHELDLDGALRRKPRLVLVDELAHTNAEGCRHAKRYQDVKELLQAGIDVYTTVNVQHIESLNDMVMAITGIQVHERVPDHMFDMADRVKLVDVEPKELIERMNEGEIYASTQAKRALGNFFTEENLTALREIALRRCADRINLLSEAEREKSGGAYHTDEHILVCLSPSPSNARIIRTAARMAAAFKGALTALYVETSNAKNMSDGDQKRLRENIRLAHQMGAKIETSYGDDVPLQIAEFARLSGASKIVIGRVGAKKTFFGKPSLTDRLIAYAPNMDIYIIPDKRTAPYQAQKPAQPPARFTIADLLKSTVILLIATGIGFLFDALGFSEANIITVYILSVLITAVTTAQRMYSLVSSLVSVLIFNYFFTDPRLTLNAYDSGYPATFAIMFIAALITSSLTQRIKRHAQQAAHTAYRTKILLDTNQLLQKSGSAQQIAEITATQIVKLLGRDAVFYLAKEDTLDEPQVYPVSSGEPNLSITSSNERAVAEWVFHNNRHAGAGTDTLSSAACSYLAVRSNQKVYGVIGLAAGLNPPDDFEHSIVLSILGECALALENRHTLEEKEQAAVLAKNEQLRANLLRSISHDLRTPLTAISGNAGMLLQKDAPLSSEQRERLCTDIYDDSLWLNNLVENLLAITRLEDGSTHLKPTVELLDELIPEAFKHLSREQTKHSIRFDLKDEMLMVKADARLMVQVIVNLVDNAIKYTQEGSIITITAYRTNLNGKKRVVVDVADDGPGISDAAKPHIFDMFYTDSSKTADSRRSLGMGLALCKSIMLAHNGEIVVLGNHPKGTIFRITLPEEEVKLHE